MEAVPTLATTTTCTGDIICCKVDMVFVRKEKRGKLGKR
jgi:hypothetical protein